MSRSTRPPAALERQSGQLLGYLDTLFRRWMLARKGEAFEGPECSREEHRMLFLIHAKGRSTMSGLADELGVPLSTATHTIDRLVAKGLVVRTRSEQDRRVVQVGMSDFGKQLQENFKGKRLSMAHSWLEPLSPGEREIFLELMAKITERAKPEA
ncbi:MAG: MarR family transcriptional regulator [Bryobacterales bacterium]|nr:MarR family transcriptional regulator [Bryobacterales bacterium]